MGYERHHAIIVSSWKYEKIKIARRKAKELGCSVSYIVKSPANGVCSFFIAPDGSKEGWDYSNMGDNLRNEFIIWIKEQEFYDWVEVQYGDDRKETKVTRHSDERFLQ